MLPLEALVAEAELGEKAREFLEGDLGKYLLGVARQEAQVAKDALAEVDPSNPAKIRELQNHIWRADQFGAWLRELVANGENAMAIYVEQTRK